MDTLFIIINLMEEYHIQVLIKMNNRQNKTRKVGICKIKCSFTLSAQWEELHQATIHKVSQHHFLLLIPVSSPKCYFT